MLEVSSKQIVKTRKKHECYGCTEIINKGEAIVHVRGKEDGRYVSFHLHVKCHIVTMKQKLFAEGFEKGCLNKGEEFEDFSIAETTFPFELN